MKVVAKYFAIVMIVIALFFTFVYPATNLFSYYNEVSNPSRYEYIEGIYISLVVSLFFWIPASLLLFYLKSSISKKLFYVGVVPTVILVVIFVSVWLYIYFFIPKLG